MLSGLFLLAIASLVVFVKMPLWLVILLIVSGLLFFVFRFLPIVDWLERLDGRDNYVDADSAVESVMGFLPHEHPEWLFDTPPPPAICPWCRSEWHESKFHPKRCIECGGTENGRLPSKEVSCA